MTLPGLDIWEGRAKVVRELPWCLPASAIMQMTDADLDALAGASEGSIGVS